MERTRPCPIIDVDTHITEPADVWTSRVPAKWRSRVPEVRWVEEEGAQFWFIDGNRSLKVGLTAAAGWPGKFPDCPPTYEKAHRAAWDANARLALMDATGTWAQVLYPNIGGFGNQLFLSLGDPELMLTCVRAYNDFQLDWISPEPRRFIPILATPFWDVPAAVQEIERCAKLSFRGILFTASPQDFGQPFLGDRHWDPLWAAACAAELPISLHIGSGKLDDGFTPERVATDGSGATYARTSCRLFLGNGIQLADLLFSGVLARFPELRFVSVESGLGWVPFVLEAADYHYHAADIRSERPELALLPSEYFRRQVYTCFWFEKQLSTDLIETLGADRILFETDFPHPTGLNDDVAANIEASLGKQPEAVRRRILCENAAELYRVELPS